MTTTVGLPLCVYCGTPRPADVSLCPSCRRPWIDIRVGDTVVVGLDAAPAMAANGIPAANGGAAETTAPDDTDDVTEEIPLVPAGTSGDGDAAWDAPPRKRRDLSRWAIPAILAVAVLVVYGLIALGFFDGTRTPAPSPQATPTTVPVTTLPPTTVAAPTTVPAPTTTAAPAPTTTTTEPPPAPGDFAPSGNPLDLSQLALKADAIGPLQIGAPISDVAGRLVASLGTPTATGYADESTGLCPGATGLWLRWGRLTVLFDGDAQTGTFAGYRYEQLPDIPDEPALATLSGLRLGDTVADVNRIYSAYRIEYGPIDGGAVMGFHLYGGDKLLLWGPVSSVEDSGTVLGIDSPPACPAG